MAKRKKQTKKNNTKQVHHSEDVRFSVREFATSFFAVVLLVVGIYTAAVTGLPQRVFASMPFLEQILEDELQTDSEAENVVSTEQERMAREKNSNDVSWEMKDDPQFVVFAFDGSKSLSMWEESRSFARQMNEAGTKFHFTYLINPIYLLTESEALEQYQPPRYAKGNSAIGYSENLSDAVERRKQITLAQKEGNEIASHAVGHWSGSDWTYEEWKSELIQFDAILHSVPTVSKKSVVGFRAPQLGQNENLFTALNELGYEYDTSLVGFAKDLPKAHNGLWEFPVATIIFGKDERPVLSMDYSIYMHQTGAKSIAWRGTELWDSLYEDTMIAYKRYFEENYNGNHAPVYIAHHFSKWNDGVYWQVMQDFAKEVCSKPNVQCVTYGELAKYLDSKQIVPAESSR